MGGISLLSAEKNTIWHLWVQWGFCHFAGLPVVGLHYKAISVAAGEGVVIKDVVFPSHHRELCYRVYALPFHQLLIELRCFLLQAVTIS